MFNINCCIIVVLLLYYCCIIVVLLLYYLCIICVCLILDHYLPHLHIVNT